MGGSGKNLLGFVRMDVRAKLRD
ncbi:hypothetical protein DSM3645_03758 [Blastopirellula marina DSM 3645]|uniref:Uncharacterized protein n=1 Tax=Blastopirellula marina DSM 3645 TaxID=314230 RepID=A3ZW63_9BACT|nr:hypothetical protein DSM3645_03758 [Blastopirellula marina DSM 3645]